MSNSTFQVAAVVVFYMVAALTMVFVNKAVLLSVPDLPLLFLFFQLAIAVVLLHISAAFSSRIEIPKFDFNVLRKLTPILLVNAIGLVFNILCLKSVEASFFQIARGLQLPLTILISSATTNTRPSNLVLVAATSVTFGFFLGVSPSSSPVMAGPSILSLFYGFLSSLCIAYHAVLIKSSLPHCGNSTIQLAWWSNACGAVVLLPLVVLNGEHNAFMLLSQEAQWNRSTFIYGTIATGLFGFLLSIAGLLSIKVTSPITHMFSSATRSVLQTLLGVWLFKDYLNVPRAISIFVILGGAMFYTWVKSIETSSSKGQNPPSPQEKPALLPRHNFVDTKYTPYRFSREETRWSPVSPPSNILFSITPEESEEDVGLHAYVSLRGSREKQ